MYVQTDQRRRMQCPSAGWSVRAFTETERIRLHKNTSCDSGWALAFAPSAKGLHLQQLLDVCSKYVSSHNVVFNVTKSQCLITKSRNDIISRPMFRVCGASLPYTDSYKYLGHIINSDLPDEAYMIRQTRALYARANTIIRKFSFASPSTKLMLFRAFCSAIYGCQLRCSMFQ